MARAALRTSWWMGALASASLGVAAPAAGAQPVTGGFEDAAIARRGELRIRFGATFDGATDQFGRAGQSGSKRVPLGSGFTFDSLGAAQIPAIAYTQRVLADSLGVSEGLSLGTVRTNEHLLVTRVPLEFEFGITSRLALTVRAPLVRTRASVQVSVNSGGGNGNLGFNPSNPDLPIGTGVASGNAAANGAVQEALTTAIGALNAKLTACPATNTTPECAAIVANRAAALQLVTDATKTRGGLASVYGTAQTGSGSPFVPVAGSAAQRAVEARLANLRSRFASFGVTNISATALPAGATALIANTGLRRILTGQLFGFGVDSQYAVERGGTGDLQAGLRFKWIDTFADSGRPGPGAHLRSTAGVAYQLGTLGTELPTLLFDVPLGSAASGVVLRSETDFGLGARFTASVAARMLQPFGDQQTVRIPYLVGSPLAPASREQTVSRTPGRELALEVTPRWAPSAAFAIAGHYAFASKQADEYTGSFSVPDVPYLGTDVFDASSLGIGTGAHSQTIGFGATYSTLVAYARRRTGLPLEVSYVHSTVISGSGGVVPRYTTDGLLVRVYIQIFGVGRRGR